MTRRRKLTIAAAVGAAYLAIALTVTSGDDSQQQRDQVHTSNVDAFNQHCFNAAGDRVC